MLPLLWGILILDKPGNKSPGKINDPYFMLNVVYYIIKHFVLTLKPWKSVEFGMLLELKIEIKSKIQFVSFRLKIKN